MNGQLLRLQNGPMGRPETGIRVYALHSSSHTFALPTPMIQRGRRALCNFANIVLGILTQLCT